VTALVLILAYFVVGFVFCVSMVACGAFDEFEGDSDYEVLAGLSWLFWPTALVIVVIWWSGKAAGSVVHWWRHRYDRR
jgi:hypothetical protein